MKLHLPGGLRAALMACFAVVTGIASTLSTATITGGVFAVAVSAQTYAADADYQDVVLNAETGSYDLTAGTTYNLSTALEGESIVLNAPSFWGAANQYHGINVDAGVSVSLSGINVRDINYPYTWLYPDHRPEHTEYTKLGGGTLTITGAPAMVGSYDDYYIHDARPSNITVNDGTLVIDFLAADGSSFVRNNVTIAEGATLTLQHENATGTWDSGCANIILTGENGKAATLEVNNVMNLYRTITLEGHAEVKTGTDAVAGSKLIATGGNSLISAGGESNVVSTDISLNANLTVDVTQGGVLELSGLIDVLSTADVTLTKKGEGELILSAGSAETVSSLNAALSVQSGEVHNTGYLSVDDLSVVSGSYLSNSAEGNLVINGEISLNETIWNEGTLTFGEDATWLNPYQLAQKVSTENDYSRLHVVIAKGRDINGAEKLFQGEGITYEGNGVFSILVKNLTFAGSQDATAPEALTWGTDSITFKGVSTGYTDKAWVVFESGYTKATLDGAVAVTGLEVAQGATLSLFGKDNTLSISVLKLDGTLELLDTVNMKLGAWQYGDACELHVNWAAAASDAYLQGYAKDVVVKGGSLRLYSGTLYDSLTVVEGGNVEFVAGRDYAGDVSLTGHGNSYGNGAAVFDNNASHSGRMTITEEGADIYVWDSSRTATIKGELVLDGALTKKQVGRLVVGGNISGYGGMILDSGTLQIGTWYTQQGSLMTGDVTVKGNSTLELHHAAGTFLEEDGKADLFLTGGATLVSRDVSDENAGYQWGILDVKGENTINYIHKGKLLFDELTTDTHEESGKLNITVSSESGNSVRVTEFAAIREFHGSISQSCSGTSQHKLVVGTVTQSQGKELSIRGGVFSSDFAKLGEGALFVDALTINGRIMMNYEGTLAGCTFNEDGSVASVINNIADVLTLNPGAVLAYGNVEGRNLIHLTAEHFAAIGEGTAKVSFDINQLTEDELTKGVNTGISGISIEDAEKYFTGLDLVKLELRTDEVSNISTLYLTYADSIVAVDWDKNWGLQASQPVYVRQIAELKTNLYLADSGYADNGLGAIAIAGTAGDGKVLSVFGGSSEYGVTASLPQGAWIKLSGGSFDMVAGGGGGQCGFKGDSHIEVGEGASVAYVVGGNTQSHYDFTGNTYVSINTSNVSGSIYGGSVSMEGYRTPLTGDTHVYIYKPLSDNSAAAWSGAAAEAISPHNSVVGGLATMRGSHSSFDMKGNTNIVIDLSSYTGEPVEFTKKLIAGSYVLGFGLAPARQSTSSHVGDSRLDVVSVDGVTFTQAVMGGDFLVPGRLSNYEEDIINTALATQEGDCHVSLTGGTYTDYVMGGCYIYGAGIDEIWHTSCGISHSTITGSTSLELNATFTKAVVGGSIVAAAESTSIIGTSGEGEKAQNSCSTNVVLSGGRYTDVIGGNLVSGTGSSSTLHNGSSVVVNGGTIAGTLVGGCWVSATEGEVEEGAAHPSITQGDVRVSMLGGTLQGDVLAAGMQQTRDDAITMTTKSTTVEISAGVVFEGERTVSGAYNEGAVKASVTGSTTLSFIDSGDYANISHTLFRDFNAINIAKGTTIELNGSHGSGDSAKTQNFEMLLGTSGSVLTKTGEGTFIMGGNMQGAAVSVQEGTLKANTSLTSVTVSNGGTLDATTAGIRVGSLTLSGKAVLTLDGSTGLALGGVVAAGEDASTPLLTLDARTKVTLNVAEPSAERIVLFTGLSEETISGIVFSTADGVGRFAMLASYVSNYADFAGGNGVLLLEEDGSLVISKLDALSFLWKWQDEDGGIWKDDTPEPGDWNLSGNPAGAPVVFGDAGMGMEADAVTTITIEGDVTPLSVLVDATSGTYVFTSSGSIVGDTSIVKEGAGTLRIENANSYTGDTILKDGVLIVANTAALGKGKTTFNGGTLGYDLDVAHTVSGDTLATAADYSGTVNVTMVGDKAAEDITWDFSGGESTAVLENALKASGEGVLTLDLADGSTVGTKLGMDIADAATAANGTTPATVGTTVKLAGDDISFAYALTGQGTLELSGITGTSTLSGDNSAFEGSIKASSGAGNITNFASNKASGGEKTTLILSDSTVELANGVTNIEAGTVQLIGDNTLNTKADFTGTVMVDGGRGAITTREGTTFTNIQLVNGGNMSVVGDLEVKGSITSGGEGYEAGGDLSVGGKGVLTIGSVKADGTRTDSRVAVGGELSGVTRINIVGNLGPLPGTTDALITADSFAAVDKKLTVAFESEEQVSYINMSIGETYTLLSTSQTLAAFDSLTLQAGATTADTESAGVLVNGMKYSLVAGANSIVLKASFNGLEWTSTDGKWDAAEDWNGTLPTATSDLGLVGGGTAEVAVADALQANSLRVDTAGAQGANAVTAYTLSGSGSLSMDGALLVSSGSLMVDALSVQSAERTVIGSLTRPEQKATLSVGAAALSTLPTDLNAATAADEFAKVGKLETGSLTLQSAAGSFTNNGLTSVTGALITELADGQLLGLTNKGMLQMGDKSNVGTITGSGVVWATGGTVTVSALDGAALAKASGGATLSVGSVNNALGFSLEGDDAVIRIASGNVTVSSLNSIGTNGGGLLDIAGKLTLERKTSSGGRVKAESVDMAEAAGSTLTSLQTGSLTLNLNTLAVGSPLLTLTDNVRNALGEAQSSSIKLTLTGAVAADGVAGMDLSTFTYDNQSNLGTRCNEQATLSDGSTYLREWTEYTLVDVTAANSLYSWDLTGTDLAELQQRFAEDNGSYAQLTATDGGDIVLKVYKDDLREWNGGDVFDAIDKTVPAESASRWAGTITNAGGEVLDLSQLGDTYTALDSVKLVNITEKETLIDLTALTNDATANPDGLLLNHLSGTDAESTLTLKGDAQDLATLRNDTLRYATSDEDKDGIADTDTFAELGSTSYAGTLVIDGLQVKAEGVLGADNKPANTLTVGTTEFAGGIDAWLNVTDTADYRTGGLVSTAKDDGKISGTITVTGTVGKGTVSNGTLSGGYSGSYSNATVALADGADQRLVLGAGANELSLISDSAGVTSAKATLSYTEGNADMGTITVTNTHLTLDNMGSNGVMNTLGVADGSTMTGGTLTFSLNAADIAAGLAGTAGTPVITNALSLKDTTVIVNLADGDKAVGVDLSGADARKTLFTLSETGTLEGLTAENIQLNGAFFNRYFDLSTLTVEKGAVIADVVTNYYTNLFSQSENGTAGLQMLDAADLELAPQGNVKDYKDLAGIMDALQGFKASEAAAADKLAAAVAGSGVASLGMALSGDVERQLKAIRNRTTTMGVDPSVVNEDMPYFNAWINAEGDYCSMDDGGTLAGYTVNSYGGTVGFDMDVPPELTWGLALTAMYGDFESTTVDKVDGDMDTYYVSAFARATRGAWTHTFVATVGMNQSELSRTVSHKYGSYTAEGEADGMSFGFLYEAARTYALNEDATACWQPVFNVSFRHISVDGYEEDGSDAALKVGDQSLNTVTFGLGGRLQSIVGENVYNRTSVFEARALVKFDVGDRESEVENALLAAPSTTATVKSAELDAIGLEVGAGLTVPVGFDGGSIFVDGSLEFRGSYTNFNAAAGYRVNF